ncbi:MAG: transposase [Natronincolaceae bacterium]
MLRRFARNRYWASNYIVPRQIVFTTTLDSFRGDNGYKLYAYCLMSNHVHILIKELDDDISTAMKRICVAC